jgi:hypothetical protein
MATYDYYKENQSPSPSPRANATVWMYCKFDFSKQNMAANDVARIFQVRDKWLLLRGFIRCLTATGVANTIDIGTSSGGQQLDAGFNTNSAGDWTIMDTLKSAGEIALTADGYIFLENLTNAASSGIVEVMIEVYAGPEDAEMDSLAE